MAAEREDIARLLAAAGRHIAAAELDAAAACYAKVMALDPGLGQVFAAYGSVRQQQDRLDEARAAYEKALSLGFDDFAVRCNLGSIAQAEGEYEEAVLHLEAAAERAPGAAAPLVNLGLTLVELGRHRDSLAHFEAALARGGFDDEVRWNRSAARLALGDYAGGWGDFESRWRIAQMRPLWREYPRPQWRGESLAGKTLFLWHEQGLGDTVQFCRYASLAAARGARVLLQVQPELARLCAGLAGVEVVAGTPLPDQYDYHSPLMSLPLAFSTLADNIPAQMPYLRADPVDVGAWAARLGAPRKPRVGVVWSSGIRRHNEALRHAGVSKTIPLAVLAPLAGLDAQFHSLQIGDGSAEARAAPGTLSLIDNTAELRDFADTAALMANLDAVVSVDTAVAHVAAAMGLPTFVLLKNAPCWRWFVGRSDSPWYPTMRLFRQQHRNDWRAPVAQLTTALGHFLDALAPPARRPGRWIDRMLRPGRPGTRS